MTMNKVQAVYTAVNIRLQLQPTKWSAGPNLLLNLWHRFTHNSLGSLKPKCIWHSVMNWILADLNNFINRRLITKSRDDIRITSYNTAAENDENKKAHTKHFLLRFAVIRSAGFVYYPQIRRYTTARRNPPCSYNPSKLWQRCLLKMRSQ